MIWDRSFGGELKLVSSRVTANPRKLRTRWRVEHSQDLQAFNNEWLVRHKGDQFLTTGYVLAEYHHEDLIDKPLPEGVSSMRQVRVSKIKLLAVLKKNRAEHRGIFIKAQAKYRQVAIKALDAQLKAARNGKPFELVNLVQLQAPEDHTEEYDRAIKMLEMCEDNSIVVSNEEFQNYVEDKWHWSRDWALSNSRYVKSAKLSAMASR